MSGQVIPMHLPPDDDGWLDATPEPDRVPDSERAAIQSESRAQVSSGAEPWVRPVPLDDASQLPSWPTHLLPDPMRDMVEAVATATQTPPDMAALLSLATLAAVGHPQTEIEVRDGWREPLAVWAAIALPPAERKSAVLGLITAPLREMEAEQVETARAQQVAHDAHTRILRARQAKSEKAAATGKGSAQHAAESALVLAEHEAARPVAPRYYVDDCTPEQLAHIMAEQGGRCAVLTAEAGIFGLLAGRYQTAPNLDLYLKGHAGEAVRVDRRSHDPLTIQRAVLSMGLAIQPSVIEGMAGTPQFRGRGLLARFLYSFPLSSVGHREIAPPAVPPSVSEAWSRCVRQAAARGPEVLRFSADALAALDLFRAELEPRLGPGGDLHDIGDWAGKLPGALVRIGALCRLASPGGHDSVISVSMSLDQLREISLYLVDHAGYALGLMGLSPEVAGARAILRWLRRSGLREFSARDAMRANAQFRRAEALVEPLTVLEERGYIRRVLAPGQTRRQLATAGPSRGRPAAPKYEVSPYADD